MYLRRVGVESRVIHRREHDPFGFLDFYAAVGIPVQGNAWTFFRAVLTHAKHADILHLHSLDHWLPMLRFLFPRKALILHYHGDEIRNRGSQLAKRVYRRFADAVLVATADLLRDVGRSAMWLPNPIDLEHWQPMPELQQKEALVFKVRYLDVRRSLALTDRSEVDIVDREANPVPYRLMPAFLNRYRVYVDAKYDVASSVGDTPLESLSTTGLQALACGLRVLDWRGHYRAGFPDAHRPENVVETLHKLYRVISKREGRIQFGPVSANALTGR
jgi:hypothetical protein